MIDAALEAGKSLDGATTTLLVSLFGLMLLACVDCPAIVRGSFQTGFYSVCFESRGMPWDKDNLTVESCREFLLSANGASL